MVPDDGEIGLIFRQWLGKKVTSDFDHPTEVYRNEFANPKMERGKY